MHYTYIQLTLSELAGGSKQHSNSIDETSVLVTASPRAKGGADSMAAVADRLDIFVPSLLSSLLACFARYSTNQTTFGTPTEQRSPVLYRMTLCNAAAVHRPQS